MTSARPLSCPPRPRARLLGVLALLLSLAPAAGASDDTARLEQAVARYGQAMAAQERDERVAGFRQAERLFAAVVEGGVENAQLYTNLGNAALQGERLGAAILAYRRALLLEPGLERARTNLLHARSLLPDSVPTPTSGGLLDSFFFWHHSASRAGRGRAAALCFALAALLLAASIYWRSPPLRALALPAALAFVGLIASLALDPGRHARFQAVIVGRDVQARAADSPQAPPLFGEALPPGTEVRIVEDRGRWMQIELANGRTAWIPSSPVRRIDAR